MYNKSFFLLFKDYELFKYRSDSKQQGNRMLLQHRLDVGLGPVAAQRYLLGMDPQDTSISITGSFNCDNLHKEFEYIWFASIRTTDPRYVDPYIIDGPFDSEVMFGFTYVKPRNEEYHQMLHTPIVMEMHTLTSDLYEPPLDEPVEDDDEAYIYIESDDE
jgi:hypothetical protein